MSEAPNRRRLWVLIPGELSTPTGGYVYERRIIEGLRSIGWQVTQVRLDDDFPFPEPAALAAAAAALRGIPDNATVLVDGLAFGALADQAAAERRRLRLLTLVHHPLADETGLAPAESARLRDSETRALHQARGVLVTSAFTARRLADYGVKPGRIRIVEPGVDHRARARGSGSGLLSLLCVATLTPRKGHDLLLRALAGLRSRSWHLNCVGSAERDPDWTAALLRLRDALGLADRVDFTGTLDPDALERHYHAADLAVLATRFEGYGMAISEALAHGLPVVCTRGGAAAETLPADAGIAVPVDDRGALSDALLRLLTDAGLRQTLADGAWRAGLDLPDWAQTAGRFAEAIDVLRDLPPPATGSTG